MSKKLEFSGLDLISSYTEKKKGNEKIELSAILPSDANPRIFGRTEVNDLVESFKRIGILEPIIVRKERNQYKIVAGERRYRAAAILGWKEIPAIVTDAPEDLCYEMALAENEKRKNLNPYEVGKAIQVLRKERGKTADQVAELLGYTDRYIKQLSSIARLDQKSVYEMIQSGTQPSVKNLEALLRKKERGEIISPSENAPLKKITINLSSLTVSKKAAFLKDLNALKKKYGIHT